MLERPLRIASIAAAATLLLLARSGRADDDCQGDDCNEPSSPRSRAPAREPEFGRGTTHTWLEVRPGAATFVDKSAIGPALSVAYGVGFQWLDLGIAARIGSNAVSAEQATGDGRRWLFALGPEIAARWSLGAGGTFRLGVDPVYAVDWGRDSAKRLGVDGLAQLLWTLDDDAKPVFRVGVGVRGGRWWTTGGEGVWNVGLDLVLRSWW